MAKLRTVIILVLLTIAEIISFKSPPAKEGKDTAPRVAYFLGPSSNASVLNSDIHNNYLTHEAKENGVSNTENKAYTNTYILTRTPCHRRRCKCAKRNRLHDNTTPISSVGRRCRCPRDTQGQNTWDNLNMTLKQNPLMMNIHPYSPIVKTQSSWVKPPDITSEVNSSGSSSEEKLQANRPNDNSHVGNVTQTHLKEEEDDEDIW